MGLCILCLIAIARNLFKSILIDYASLLISVHTHRLSHVCFLYYSIL